MQVTESPVRYKSSVKTKERKTNNLALFGGSLLQNNMEVDSEAAIDSELALHLPVQWTRQVCTGFAPGLTKLGQVWSVRITQTGHFWFAQKLYKVWIKFTWFVPSLHNV